MRIPPLLADFIYNRGCELKCEKFLTRPILHRLDSRFSSRYLVGPDIGCSDSRASFLKKDGGWSTAAAKGFGTNCPKALSRNKGL